MSTIANILKKDKSIIDVISFSTHERVQSGLAKIPNVRWWLLNGSGHIKEWDFNYAKLPPNHYILHNNHLPANIDPDFILCQNKAAHYNVSQQLAQKYQIPIWHLEHTLPPPNWGPDHLLQYQSAKCDLYIFISEYNKGKWGYNNNDKAVVIEHGVDTELFSPKDIPNIPRDKHAVVVCNDYVKRDMFLGFRLFQQITGLPNKPYFPIRIVGNTPEIGSKPAKDIKELIDIYNTSQVFLNTSLVSPIPTVLLEASAMECAIVSTNNCLTPSIFTHGKDAFLSNDPNELREYCLLLLSDEKLAKKMGQEARKTIVKRFNMERFVNDWTKYLDTYIRS